MATKYGICFKCKKETIVYSGSSECRPCSASRSRERRKNHRALGLCSCGRKKAEGDDFKCVRCREQNYIQGRKPCVKEYRARNLKRMQMLASLRLRKIKTSIFEKYGGVICKCCGETTIEFLSLDHIAGDGAKHRREIGGGANTYRWIIKNNFPPGFQVLCMNCNFAKGKSKYCPHGNLPEAMPPVDKLIPPLAPAPYRYLPDGTFPKI